MALEIPGAKDNRYMFFLLLPTEDELRLKEGDTFKVVFNIEAEDWMTAWNCRVIHPLPGMPCSYVCAIGTRTYDKKKKSYVEKTKVEAHPWKLMLYGRQALYTALAYDEGVNVRVRINVSDQIWTRRSSLMRRSLIR